MGFFSGPAICDICGKEAEKKHKAMDGVVCDDCFKNAGYTFGMVVFGTTIDEIKAHIEQNKINKQAMDAFEQSRIIKGLLSIDDKNQKWFAQILLPNSKFADSQVYSFSQVKEAWVEEDDTVVTTTKADGLGRAAVGGALLGSTGAVVGAVTGASKSQSKAIVNKICVVVRLKESSQERLRIVVSVAPLQRGTSRYDIFSGTASEILDAFNEMIASQTAESPAASTADPTAEIRKFKALLDDGIITQDEFDLKKKQLLGL